MAGFPNFPGGAAPSGTPPPTIPGVTQPTAAPPADLIRALTRKPEQATQLIRQAILLLQQAAEIDPRQEPRLSAAQKLLRGPAKPDTEP
jgi:hypothetical protein